MAEKKNRGKVAQQVFDLARPVAEEMGLLLWDVDFYKEGAEFNLLVTIDRPEGGVGLSDCEALSRALSPLLDEADPIPESYVFEVGSAGAERELKRPSDFEQFMGHEVELKLYKPLKGRKTFVGTLAAYEDGAVTLSIAGESLRFAPEDIAQVRLHVSF